MATKTLIANAVAVLATVGATIGAADLFLPSGFKKRIDQKSLEMWYWLAKQKPSEVLKRYRNENRFRLLAMYAPLTVGVVHLFFSPLFGETAIYSAIASIPFGISNVLLEYMLFHSEAIFRNAYNVYIWAIGVDNIFLILARVYLVNIVYLIVYIFTICILYVSIGRYMPDEAFVWIVALAGILVLQPLSIFLVASLFFLKFFNIAILTVIHGFLEWFVRKAVETGKGFLLGISAVLGGISTLLQNIF